LIDLHTHTTESDGTCAPGEVIAEAAARGLTALSITDHDTLSGYEKAVEPAARAGIDLVCGIELSTKLRGRSVHLLAYFLDKPPAAAFWDWLRQMQESRRERNLRMAEKLRTFGFDISIEEVERLGRSIAGRPHFARIMVQKGYVRTIQQAFDDYLDESAKGYVDRYEPDLAEAVGRVAEAGGVTSLAHPIRVRDQEAIPSMRAIGLDALEAYHSDHDEAATARYLDLADRCGYAVTGGSDFHGTVKPNVALGCARVPGSVLDRLRERFASHPREQAPQNTPR
jgi:predicted metal-dependent phosphoesterase TrpH